MTDYEIQKATASKVGVVSPPDNIYECRKAILEKLGGDSTDADTIYECDKRILPLIGSGSANLQEKSVNITENGTTTYSPDSGFDGFSDFSVNVNVPPTPTQEKSVNITENGTQRIVPNAGYNLSGVDVTVDVNAQGSLKLVNGTKLSQSTFTEVPDYDFSDVTDMSYMFSSCTSLTTIPNLDTSKVTDMRYMFNSCTSLTTIPNLDTSNVTDMCDMFSSCKSLTTIPNLDTSNVTDMSDMFYFCISLTTIPNLNTSNVYDYRMQNMFYFCTSLTTIPLLDMSNVSGVLNTFYYCSSLTDLGGFVNLGKAFTGYPTLDLSSTSILTNQSVQNIIDTIYDMNQNTQGGSATLKLNQTVIDAMTDEQKSQLSAKGWTLTN